jgi:endonuclease/exonuclease/phosphatase (EEP) superfamily protein YafD
MFDRFLDNSARVGWLLENHAPWNTRPDIGPQHIDYVWYRGDLEPAGVYIVNDSGGSDHFPVLAFFDLK